MEIQKFIPPQPEHGIIQPENFRQQVQLTLEFITKILAQEGLEDEVKEQEVNRLMLELAKKLLGVEITKQKVEKLKQELYPND